MAYVSQQFHGFVEDELAYDHFEPHSKGNACRQGYNLRAAGTFRKRIAESLPHR